MDEKKIPVPDEALEGVAGGAGSYGVGDRVIYHSEPCPQCGTDTYYYEEDNIVGGEVIVKFRCQWDGTEWEHDYPSPY